MNILVLGGTGAMGRPLVSQLSVANNVFVTTRKNPHSFSPNKQHVTFLIGNAKNVDFLSNTLKSKHWDAVVDFMIWGTEFPVVLPLLLESTNQYVFVSSARVYAQSDVPITEETPRLLDVSSDSDYLKTNEYALAKAREEDMLFHSGKINYTVVRPTVTYNSHRLQLGVLEMENWLYRALHGRSIVFSDDIADKITTMTHGDDVAKGIASLIGKECALGETFHITSSISLPWNDVLDIYLSVLEKHLGHRPHVVMTEKSTNLKFKNRVYQVIYCRYFNRSFDNSKVSRFCDVSHFVEPYRGLADCLEKFLMKPIFREMDWKLEAVNDKVSGERTSFSEIPSLSGKIDYLAYRYGLEFIIPITSIAGKVCRKLSLLFKRHK